MRLADRDAIRLIKANFGRVGRSGNNVIYTEKGNSTTVLKAAGFRVDGETYGQPPFAQNEAETSESLKREAAVYHALGQHPHVASFICLEMKPGGDEAWGIRLARAPRGNLREFISNHNAPDIADRLRIATDFVCAVQHLHDCGVVWGDLSTRNALVFDDYHIKLCDFAGSSLRGTYTDITYAYEFRYWPPVPNAECPALGSIALELFALGTAICEITEWTIPYDADDDKVNEMLRRRAYPHVSSENPARDVIQACWSLKCPSAQAAAQALAATAHSEPQPCQNA